MALWPTAGCAGTAGARNERGSRQALLGHGNRLAMIDPRGPRTDFEYDNISYDQGAV